MVRSLVAVFICCMMLLAVSTSAQAEWWSDPKVKQAVGLSDKQIEEMNKLSAAFKAKRNEIGSNFRTSQSKVNAMLSEQKIDEAGYKKAMDEAAQMHSQVYREMGTMKLEIRKLLTSEQVKKLLAEQPEVFNANRLWIAGGSRPTRHSKSMMMKKGKTPMMNKGGEKNIPDEQNPMIPAPAAPSEQGSKK
jgi:Spy/CpxP family protein refolding chaperone